MNTVDIEGHEVPQEVIDAVRLAIGQHCPSSVDGQELSDMVRGAIGTVLRRLPRQPHLHFHIPAGHILNCVGDVVRVEPWGTVEDSNALAMLSLSGELGGRQPTETQAGYLRRLLDFVAVNGPDRKERP